MVSPARLNSLSAAAAVTPFSPTLPSSLPAVAPGKTAYSWHINPAERRGRGHGVGFLISCNPGNPEKSLSWDATGQPSIKAVAAIQASAVFSLRPALSLSARNSADILTNLELGQITSYCPMCRSSSLRRMVPHPFLIGQICNSSIVWNEITVRALVSCDA